MKNKIDTQKHDYWFHPIIRRHCDEHRVGLYVERRSNLNNSGNK